MIHAASEANEYADENASGSRIRLITGNCSTSLFKANQHKNTRTLTGISDFVIRVTERRLNMFSRFVTGLSRANFSSSRLARIVTPPLCAIPATNAHARLVI